MSRDLTDIWILKYALTTGIRKVRGYIVNDRLVEVPAGAMKPYPMYFHGREWASDEESAKKLAEEMRVAKLAQLERQVAKLRDLKF